MTTSKNRLEFEWWVVKKRVLFTILAIVVVCLLGGLFGLYVWKYGNPFAGQGGPAQTLTGARFISFEGDVRVIRAATRETISASTQIQLFPGDTVQTQADGRARIGLADGSSLFVRPNSTVIIRENTRPDDEQKGNVRVVVGMGNVKMQTEDQPVGMNNVVETPKTESRIASRTGASFGVSNEGTEIRVSSGSVDTSTNSGEKATLRAGEFVSVNQTGTLTKRERLLDVPTLSAPDDLERMFVGPNGSANVSLRWQRPISGTPAYYRVEVSTSGFFVPAGRVVEREQLAATELEVTNLRPGAYYWRVFATAQSGQVSEPTDGRKFTVSPKSSGENVPVTNIAPEFIGGSVYLIRGKAPPGTTIRISGRETFSASDWSFQLQISAPPGTREVTLEALDAQGNISRYRVALAK